ncbi:MAG: hypothetical protein A2073_06295 [Deltaproteobacteria bacterium GWC2_42_11]|nr:MAG: hypothetical protein A2073_06295 [Deltaproteobacteria bacterium GWC2_42_11]HBO84367.1 hypothetical protein [Deltaproteobacteria bacterium]
MKNSGRFLIILYQLMLVTVLAACSDDPALHIYQRAEELLSKGDYIKAIKNYQIIVEKHPGSQFASQAQYKTGRIYNLYMHNDNEAVRSYERLMLMYPYSTEVFSARKDMAEIYNRQGNYQKAISEYQWLTENSSGYGREQFHYEIAMCYLKLSDTAQTRIELQELTKNYPFSDLAPKIYYQIANTYYLEGKLNDAIKAYDYVIRNYPEDAFAAEAKLGKAVCLEETDNLNGALKLYKEVADRYTNKEAVWERIRSIEARLK